MKRVAIYIQVSTSKQDTDNQRRELEEVAERSGWKIIKVYEDAGFSGAKGRDQRRDRMLFPLPLRFPQWRPHKALLLWNQSSPSPLVARRLDQPKSARKRPTLG
ncbi:recombinase family protein [Bradyrhizobium valentinum]|uniref:Resolvase/invertase-type recombinase catalytic domain-containing protein n=1 Tax=Bradyrhizobium valentinum TaxID=1518501 RepID=A0A0R3L5Q2_9BRAD|nr:recombinase family protein [Bradyrhizobium valentinum]KRR03236.1 hypothetical protein CP49_14900 [Bradyrhizobium valentinum]KRR11726.1 hypothetical protein CQ10_39985 [Bradyrhizobium valentinum]